MSRSKESRTVLIVDDEERLRKALEKSLSVEGRQTVSAASGEDAIAVLEERRIDLVITDLVMPGMDGMALVRRLKSESPNLKTIIITAYGSPESKAEAESLGVDCYLAKPFDLSYLKSKVNELLRMQEPSAATLDSSCDEEGFEEDSHVLRVCCSGVGKAMGMAAHGSRRAFAGLSPRKVIAGAGRAARAVAGVCGGIQEAASGLMSKNSEVNGQ